MASIEYALRAADIARLTAVPEAQRSDPALTATAAATLAWWYGSGEHKPSIGAKIAYAKAYAAAAEKIGAPLPNPFVPPGPPWAAFVGGPYGRPAVVELMQPQAEEPGWLDSIGGAVWTVFRDWTNPGMMYQILVEGEVPTNGLLKAMEAATGKVANMAGQAIAPVADGLASLAWGVAALGVIYLVATRRKDGRR